jgi:hypothetical protein
MVKKQFGIKKESAAGCNNEVQKVVKFQVLFNEIKKIKQDVLCYHSYFKETVESQYKHYTINMKYFSPNTNIYMDSEISMCTNVLKFSVFLAKACLPL